MHTITIPYRWGQVLALLDAATPRGIRPARMHNAMTAPAVHFAPLLNAATLLTPELEAQLSEVLDDVQGWPAMLSTVEQGDAQLGYYHTRVKIAVPEHTQQRGRPLKKHAANWSDVDWSKSDSEIADDAGCTRQAVYYARRRARAPSK